MEKTDNFNFNYGSCEDNLQLRECHVENASNADTWYGLKLFFDQ